MQRIAIAVAACIFAASGVCLPARALPQGAAAGLRAAPAPMLLPVRYHRHRHHHEERSAQVTEAADGAIKAGQWQFAAQLEAAALAPAGGTAAAGAAPFGGGATKTTYAICVAADNAVPSAFVAGCRLDAVHRDGGQITWSMTCTNRQNAVRSDGVAQYRGDTMTATMVSHLPTGKKDGGAIDVAQRITGHYLGPCPAAATGTVATVGAAAPTVGTKAAPPAPAPTEGATSAAGEPEASTAAPTGASAAPPGAEHVAHHRRHRRYRRHYAYRRRRYGGGYFGGGSYSGFGPNPYSANGY